MAVASHGYLKQAHAHLHINELFTSYIPEFSTSLNRNNSPRLKTKKCIMKYFAYIPLFYPRN